MYLKSNHFSYETSKIREHGFLNHHLRENITNQLHIIKFKHIKIMQIDAYQSVHSHIILQEQEHSDLEHIKLWHNILEAHFYSCILPQYPRSLDACYLRSPLCFLFCNVGSIHTRKGSLLTWIGHKLPIGCILQQIS